MINFNGIITDQSDQLINNRAFLYGDSVFETLRIIDNKIVFWEDHYFRLMSSMRIIRLDIPDFIKSGRLEYAESFCSPSSLGI